ncbi:copper chaperone CopZ [Alkalihalobacillus alcalophilus ATCC 27647 = CGMCC 1.3604]|uniref:Copper chaperone CopZ n=1 Tax=Alkalihalobacillus alcalophilus ATCC 27647 = CGMCC 1.3604 TaxID=1218173 RepID=A0A094WI00_ALKAL|nr:copper chaperone CopZ [Alkalihalobacillus alcalophilus]KGA96441.1 copper resistance protein CopZ [Alkalihalobacillus alcalophilus ATCC 27647 = CGMCC 1.3604]MED1562861.1 copper chaperone CopZ [Alkalihalobacillus alcalophilus]THG90133.1 copper chaperone CopZ [Alkalihalobacillus alcalophilus ATCC 27647 = CGMCC 1.3604]
MKEVLNVEGMSCGHCVKAVESNVGELSGVSQVSVDLSNGKVEVQFDADKVTLAQITETIEEQGYDVK